MGKGNAKFQKMLNKAKAKIGKKAAPVAKKTTPKPLAKKKLPAPFFKGDWKFPLSGLLK